MIDVEVEPEDTSKCEQAIKRSLLVGSAFKRVEGNIIDNNYSLAVHEIHDALGHFDVFMQTAKSDVAKPLGADAWRKFTDVTDELKREVESADGISEEFHDEMIGKLRAVEEAMLDAIMSEISYECNCEMGLREEDIETIFVDVPDG